MAKNNSKILNGGEDSDSDKDSIVEEELDDNEEINEEMDQSNDDENEDLDVDEPQAGPSKQRNLSETSADDQSAKKKKRGIIYISTIPKYMNVSILREMLGQYAVINRVFLQPGKTPEDDNQNKKKKKRRFARHFTEGWVEFDSKRAAKQVALQLNNKSMATRKSSKFYDILWSIKYLPRFKWTHLSERLTYERAVYRQKLQSEISQARREAAFFQENLDKSEHVKNMKKKKNKSLQKAIK